MSSNPTIGQVELTPVGQRFAFACHPGVKCFNLCCAKLELPLTPYDVLRLKNCLGLPAGEFLEQYTEPAKANRSRWTSMRICCPTRTTSHFCYGRSCVDSSPNLGRMRLKPLLR